jgi:hypothetical protein
MDDQINKLVHESLGRGCWHISTTTDDFDMPTCVCDLCGWQGVMPSELVSPDYTTSLDAAMKYAEKLIADGFDFEMFSVGRPNVVWRVNFLKLAEVEGYEMDNPSAAKAICIAGLKAEGKYDLVQSEQLQREPHANDPESSRGAK